MEDIKRDIIKSIIFEKSKINFFFNLKLIKYKSMYFLIISIYKIVNLWKKTLDCISCKEILYKKKRRLCIKITWYDYLKPM